MSDLTRTASSSSSSLAAVTRKRGRPRAQIAVVESALELIKELGPKNVTMEAIADRAGVSKITLYRRWTSRATILADALFAELEGVLPIDPAGDPFEVISTHVENFVGQLEGRTGELLREIIAEYLASPDMLPAFRDRYLGLRRKAAVAAIRRGQSAGKFKATAPAEVLHDQLYGALFYRFLFGFGSLSGKDALLVMHSALESGR